MESETQKSFQPREEEINSVSLKEIKPATPKSLRRLDDFLKWKYFQHKDCEVFEIGKDSGLYLEPVEPGRYDEELNNSYYEKKTHFHTFCPECDKRIDLHSILSSESIQIALGGYLPDVDEPRSYLVQNFFGRLGNRSEINAAKWSSKLTADRWAGELEISNQFLKAVHQVIMCPPEDTEFYLKKLERLRGGKSV